MFDDPVVDRLEHKADNMDLEQHYAVADQTGLSNMLDQSLWEASFKNISDVISSVSIGAAALMRPGSTFNENFRYPDVCGSTSASMEEKEHVRIESVIALRLINIIMLLIRAAAPWL